MKNVLLSIRLEFKKSILFEITSREIAENTHFRIGTEPDE